VVGGGGVCLVVVVGGGVEVVGSWDGGVDGSTGGEVGTSNFVVGGLGAGEADNVGLFTGTIKRE
jgi:hypothetical protein